MDISRCCVFMFAHVFMHQELWHRLAQECPGVSSRGMGWWWPAAGFGALRTSVCAWDLLKEVTIIFITSTIASVSSVSSVAQSCPTLWDPIDGSPPGSPVPRILQARTMECVAISFSNAWKWKVKVKSLSHVRLLATPRTAAYQAAPSMGFSRQECWSGVPAPGK